jgi:uncharacterized protein YjbI with pentapeptide repeats
MRANLFRWSALETDLRTVKFSQTNLAKAHLTRSLLEGQTFLDCDLTLTMFLQCLMGKANFEGTSLAQTQFTQSSLAGARFSGVQASFVSFVECDLTGADLR